MNPTNTLAVNAFIEQIDSSIAAYAQSCTHCGLCADACLFYTETQDPKYTPIHKVELLKRTWLQEFTVLGKLGKKLGFLKPISDADLVEWETVVYDGCTLCGRCSMVCPAGIDISTMIRKSREAFSTSKYAPKGLKNATKLAIETGSPMGVKFPALAAQIKHIETDYGLAIPVDVKGADYMTLISSMETIYYPEYIAALAKIFKHANVSWTICSAAFEATNAGIQIGASDLAAELVEKIVAGAESLNVKNVISPECGHAYTALRWEGPNLIGRPYPFTVVHILELLDQLRQAGRIKTKGSWDEDFTFHDPCQLVRKGGVVEEPRQLMKLFTSQLKEMPDAGVMNWCCGGGGGVSANSRAEDLKHKVFNKKKTQIEAVGVNTVMTACANCRMTFEEAFEHYDMKTEIISLTEKLAEYLDETK